MPRVGPHFRAWSLAAAAALAGGPALAQSPEDRPSAATPDLPAVVPSSAVPGAAPSGDYADLLERLRAAERRLADLEAERAGGASDPGRVRVAWQEEPPAEGDDADAAESGGADTGGDEAEESGDSLAERFEALAEEWEEYQAGLEEAAAAKKAEPTFEIGGRIHFDYWSFLDDSEGAHFFEHPDPGDPSFGTDPEDRFLFRRIRIEMQGDVPDLMLWRMQVEFSEPANPEIRDVYLGWELPYNNTLIVGNQKRPIGLDSIHSSRFTVFMERPLSNDAFNEDARRLGAQIWGYSDDLLFNWRYGVFNLENVAETGQYRGDSLQLGGYGRLAATPWYDEASDGRGYLHLGVAGALARPDGDVGPADSNENQARFRSRPSARTDQRWIDTGRIRGAEWFEQAGLESVLTIGSWYFEAEYLTTAVQRDDTTRGTGPDVFFHGGYVQAAYFLTGEYMPWDRETGQLDRVRPLENFFLIDRCSGGTGGGWGAWQVKARYDYLDLTDADIRGGVQNDVTFGLNWWWNPFSRLQFDVTRGEIEQHRPVGGFDSGDFWHLGTRFAVDF